MRGPLPGLRRQARTPRPAAVLPNGVAALAGAAALAVLAAVASLAACRRAPVRPNVLLVTFDTTRADRLGCYGFRLARTPRVDRLAREGVRCTDAVAAAPITLPSHSTILTGLWPPAHGVRDNGTFALGDKAVTLAERLKSAGYETQAFVSALVLNRRYGLAQGFDGYDDDLWAEDQPNLFMIRDRRASRTAGRFLSWLEKRDAREKPAPFFAWVHFFDPHQPLRPLAADLAFAPTAYDAEISAADRGLGALLDGLDRRGLLDDTLVIVTADHGESLGDHGEKTHAIFVYDSTVRVPLVMRLPGLLPRARTYTGPVRHVDVVPTVLAALGLPGGDETQGRNLLPYVTSLEKPPALPQYSESFVAELGFGMAPLQSLRSGGFKYIRAPRPELYDLVRDPQELASLLPGEERRAARLSQEMDRIESDSVRYGIDSTGNPMTRETMETLVSLGYLAPATERRVVKGMDPKDGLLVYNELEKARHLAQRGKWQESEVVLRGILAGNPAHVSARNVLGIVLLAQRRFDEARAEYVRSLKDDPKQDRVYVALGSIAREKGDLVEAERLFRTALEITPGFVEAIANLGLLAAERGDDAGAAAWYAKASASDPAYPRAHRLAADLAFQKGDFRAALDGYRKSLAVQKNDFSARIQEGNCQRRLGDLPGAAATFAKAASLRPDSWIPDYNLACLAVAEGDLPAALRRLDAAQAKGVPRALLDADHDLDPIRAKIPAPPRRVNSGVSPQS